MKENALLVQAAGKVGYRWIEKPVKKVVEEVDQAYSDEKKKLPREHNNFLSNSQSLKMFAVTLNVLVFLSKVAKLVFFFLFFF